MMTTLALNELRETTFQKTSQHLILSCNFTCNAETLYELLRMIAFLDTVAIKDAANNTEDYVQRLQTANLKPEDAFHL